MGRTRGLIQAGRRRLPTGGSLPDEIWRRRHRGILILLWVHAGGVFGFGLLRGFSLAHMASESAVIVLAAVVAGTQRFRPNIRMAAATMGLLSSSAILVHLSGGVIEMHFHFFVMVAVITLYQSWLPFLLAIGYVVIHHGVAGALDPSSVFNHPSAIAHPWRWASIHGAFILAESVACLTAWRLNEAEGARAEDFHRQLSAVVQSSHDAIIGLTLKGLIVTWNPAAESLFGYTAFEVIDRRFGGILVPPEQLDAERKVLDRVLMTGAVERYETQSLRRDGSSVDVAVTMSPILQRDGAVIGASMIVRDVTVRIAAEREREAATEAMRDFVAIASHELRTPITVVKGMGLTLRDRWESIPPEMRHRQLDAIVRNSGVLASLVDDLLVVSRIESGSIERQPVHVDIAAVCRQIMEDIREEDFELRIPEHLKALVDPSHLDQMLINYIRNARAYGSPPYRIDASGESGSTWIAVVDHGPGVPSVFEPRLFEKFARADKQESKTKGGSGLGLSLVRGLARAADGDAWCERIEPSESRFYVRLPSN